MDEIKKRFEQVVDMGVSVRDMVMELLGTALFVLVGLLAVVYSNQDTPLSGKTLQILSEYWCGL